MATMTITPITPITTDADDDQAIVTNSPIPDSIRALIDARDQLQRARIQWNNRLSAIERGSDAVDTATQQMIQKWHDQFLALEKDAEGDIKKLVKGIPIVDDLAELKGIGLLTAAKLLSMIDISRSPTVSALWRYCGYGVREGERDRPVKGEKLCYNKRAKTTLYLIAGSFLKSNSPYRAEYDRARARYTAQRPDWTKAHIHAASLRKMIKLFLSHLYVHWRTMEDLPVRPPYVHEYLQHTSYEDKADYGWPVLPGDAPKAKPATPVADERSIEELIADMPTAE